MSSIRLYHTGFLEIREPDIHYGRKNADFGQGFYLSPDEEFSKRWAREKKGEKTYINIYELETQGLNIKRLTRGEEWFDYIFSNRTGAVDTLSEFDVIAGPIANDTIYDTFGITTSALLESKTALELLLVGGEYEQVVIKTQKAADNLKFIFARVIEPDEARTYKKLVAKEEERFQELFAKRLEELTDSDT